MSSRIIELKWKCAECGNLNLGRYKECQAGCGSSREKGEMQKPLGLDAADYENGFNKSETVTDPTLLKLARSGYDWYCKHCDSGNIGTSPRCSKCGALQNENESQVENSKAKYTDLLLSHEEDISIPGSTSKTTAIHLTEKGRQALNMGSARLPRASSFNADEDELHFSSSSKNPFILAGAGILALCIGGFFFWGCQEHPVEGVVSNTTWEHNTLLQRWTDTEYREWKHKIFEQAEVLPVNGAGERAGKEIVWSSCRKEHWDDERYQCGTQRQCTPKYKSVPAGETCTSSQNGFAHCTTKYRSVSDGETCRDVAKYCSRPIYKDRCDVKTQTWKTIHSKAVKGKESKTRWAQIDPGELDRLRYTATYDVEITYKSPKPHVYHFSPADTHLLGGLSAKELPFSAAETNSRQFESWKLKDIVTLDVTNFGTVADVHHGGIKVEK